MSPSDVVRAQKKKEKLSKLASFPSPTVIFENSSAVDIEEEPTQLQVSMQFHLSSAHFDLTVSY
jgi:hypothetical protein